MPKIPYPPAISRKVQAWVNVVVVLCAVLMGAGAVIAAVNPGLLVGPHVEINQAVTEALRFIEIAPFVLAAIVLALIVLTHR